VLLKAATAYREDEAVVRGYSKHPATWLNQHCWLDDPTPNRSQQAQRNGHQHYRNPTDQSVYDRGFDDE